jgi:hypothetical protein
MSEGALEYTLIKETKVNIDTSTIIDKLARIVDDKLDDYYLYEEEPYLSNDEGDESCTIYLNKDGHQGSPCDWSTIFTKAIKRLAQDIAEERGLEE